MRSAMGAPGCFSRGLQIAAEESHPSHTRQPYKAKEGKQARPAIRTLPLVRSALSVDRGDVTTIDAQVGSIDETREGTREKDHGRRHLLHAP